ncbi:MAG: hypothetical protein EBX15_00410 [Acidimicrobiia bacterium]|nr:hypothetical protein [Acidimicrobiia bacterium]
MFYFGTNTKQHLDIQNHEDVVEIASLLAKSHKDVQFFVLPTMPLVRELKKASHGTGLWVGAQRVSGTQKNVTGKISAKLLADSDLDLVMVGHAERRAFGARPARGGADRKPARDLKDENRRVRKFAEPAIPEEVTGKELEKREAFALQSLALENAEMVAKHLVALNMFLESDPERAYWHGQSAVFRAGRVAIVREKAGIAALHFKKFDVAIKESHATRCNGVSVRVSQGLPPNSALR